MAEVVPRGVKAAGDKSRELLKMAQAGGQPQTDVSSEAPASTEVPAAAPATQQGSGEDNSDQANDRGALDRPKFIDPADWESRFNQLRNTRNEKALVAEQRVEQLTQDLGSKDQEIARLTAELDTAKAQPERLVELSPEEREQLGDAAPVFDKFASRLQEKFTDIGQSNKAGDESAAAETAKTNEANFYADLESLVPNLKTQDSDPGFLAWLAEPDGLSGETRMELLQRKQAALDAVGVANIFKAYAPATSGQETANVNVDPGQNSGRPIAPSSEEELAASEVWVTQSEIAQLYTDRRVARSRGLMRPGNPTFEDISAREKLIGEAMAANRVRPG